MIKEKYINAISFVLISTALFFCFIIYFYNKFTPETLVTPDYVNKIFNKDEVLQINIDISEENFTSLIENAIEEKYVVANITINDTTINNVGIRTKGNSSLQQVASNDDTDRFSFKINFSEYISDQNLYGLEKLVLNNTLGDTTYMKEYLSYDLMEFLGVNTPAYAFANIKINNSDWGLYLAVETLEEDFLERYYGKDYGNLYKPESDEKVGNKANNPPSNLPNNIRDNNGLKSPYNEDNNNFNPQNKIDNENRSQNFSNNTYKNNSPTRDNTNNNFNFPNKISNNKETSLIYIDDNTSSYSKIFDSIVTKGLTELDKNNYIKMVKSLDTGKNMDKYLDIDEILRYFAANTFLVNLDSYAGSMKHNYYLYEENGVFQILPWDFNLSFGTFQMNDSSKVINFPIDTPVTDTMENSPLISSILNVNEYKNLYHSYLDHIVNNYINSGYFKNKINYLNDLIYEYVKNDKTAFYSLDEYNLGVENLIIFGEDRAKSIYLQLNNMQPSTEYGTLETKLNIQSLGSINNMDNKKDNLNKNNEYNP
ncbi:MAG: CotH kinase family protein, partial [Lachnospirales bacterium]